VPEGSFSRGFLAFMRATARIGAFQQSGYLDGLEKCRVEGIIAYRSWSCMSRKVVRRGRAQ